ncbi:MAG: ATP synthase complex assembly protein atp12 [Chaenotheca gracillima]|nr:MAG: ATP synthase complex assembly protein atp12 [Chaenotheca gracillima]
MHSFRHKARLSKVNSAASQASDAASVSPGGSIPPSSEVGDPPAREKSISIEQSVRTFRLFEVLRSGDTAAISKAIKENADTGDSLTGSSSTLEGTTILHLAIQCAESAVVEYILSTATGDDGGVNINARDREGNTALHLTSMLGRASIVRLILDQDTVNDTIQNYQGKTPLDLARSPDIYQQLQLARSLFLDQTVKEVQALVAKAEYGDLEKLLVEPRVQTVLDVNGSELATDPVIVQTGGTLLHEATKKKDARLIQILLLNGADPFRRDRKGKLPQDITKDDKIKAVLKKSPAAAVAQRGIQEKAVLGNTPQGGPSAGAIGGDGTLGGKEGREMKGYLKKWTNYTSGYKLRWFVLEDGVLSYYKHQDDAGSACRGAINMRIARLYMDPQDKQRFEIQGKSSVKYHLKANHVVEAKRWFWALNNAIQWAKDEAKEEERKKNKGAEALKQARQEQAERDISKEKDFSDINVDASSVHSSLPGGRVSRTLTHGSMPALGGSRSLLPESSIAGDEDDGAYGSYEPSISGDFVRVNTNPGTATIEGEVNDDDEEYGEDGSSRELRPASKDAFNITAQSARLQLDLLAQVSGALQAEKNKNPDMTISDPTLVQAMSSYEAAVRSLKGLVGDLLKISKDRDAYWQYRLDRETQVRRLWEDSMARLAKEQEVLEDRIGESEDKRKRTKRALRDALENGPASEMQSPAATTEPEGQAQLAEALESIELNKEGTASARRKSVGFTSMPRKKSTIAEFANISDSESDLDEEFFDAVDAGEVEVVNEMPTGPASPPPVATEGNQFDKDVRTSKAMELQPSFKGYEDPVRKRLKLDVDDRPKVGLWGILKSMIGKDMTKMTLPVSFNEPTSLLQRTAEDMEYTDLLDTAADRPESTERMVYVAAFASSEYASTIGRVAKPFNPLLGETFEYSRPEKQYRFFIEQVSHHPPIGAAWAESPRWDYYGEANVKSKFYGKSFEFNHLGTWFLKLRTAAGTEELYTWKKVTSSVVGIITNNPTVDNYGPMEVKNWTTGDSCVLDFKQRGWRASGAYEVKGKVVGADGHTRWSIGGHWNDKIYARLTPGYDVSVTPPHGTSVRSGSSGPGQAFLVWEANKRPQGIPFNLTPFGVTLNAVPDSLKPYLPPTDTRLRPDQRAMEDGEYDFAATEKNRVEEKQRAKRRARENSGEEFMPRWYVKDRDPVSGIEYWRFTGEYWKMRDEVSKGGEWRDVESIF